MLLQIDYSNDLFSLKISNPTSDFEISSFRHLISDSCDDYFLKNDIFYLSHLSFTRISSEIARFLRNHNSTLQLSEKAKSIIADTRNKSYSEALRIPQRSPDELITTLHSKGFSRRLNNNQLNNLTKISQFPAAATFSVPGAGKTTEALAFFFTNAEDSDHLLVVCPLNAMGAWDEQMSACCQNKNYSFTRLRGGEVAISRILSSNPRYMIISYQQFTIVTNLMYSFLEKHSVFMFLDESHRIKSGISGTTTQAILKTSCLPKRKLIMSGTPCPQSLSDLIPQFYFLYPDKSVSKDTVVDTLRPVFVRTTKSQLGIPPIQQKTIHLEMGPIQLKVYNQLRSEICRSKSRLSKKGKAYLRNLGKKIIKIMEFVANPSLLARDMEYVFNKKIGDVLSVDCGPKIEYACSRARELAAQGEKVIIWSQFVNNVLLVTERLKDIGADCIYGDVASGDELDADTREGKIREFHINQDKKVLVLNPSAAAEAISLHEACKYAIYVDRSFNAAHFLQSQDRIHRLGIEESPTIEILQCKNSIDEVIDSRLKDKILVMSKALEDPSLNVESIPYDSDFSYCNEDLSPDDIQEVLRFFDSGD